LVLFNYALKELTAKIVYYGPGLSGKTTNLQYIYEELPIKNKGRMLTLATETDRTLYFDFLPVDAGVVRGIKTRVQLYTVPGQVFYNATRRMVLKGADGVVFVADSQKSMVEANLESFENLRENLAAHDLNLDEMPLVMQFNKRDLEDIMTPEEMSDTLNKLNAPFYEAVAKDGIGVEDTLQAISGLVLKSVIDKYGGGRKMTPLGKAVADPARTDPEAVVSTTARAAVGRTGGRAGGGPPDLSAKATTWPSQPEEDSVPSDDERPADSFENLNIEGILDEALKLDEQDAESTATPPQHPTPGGGVGFNPEDESMFSGLLDEALGATETESILGGSPAAAPREVENDPMSEIEKELLGDTLDPVTSDNPGSNLSELVKTRVSIPTEKVTTNAPVTEPRSVEVPLTVEVQEGESEIELVLKIRLIRK
jgi:small GTP-binding protein